ncbi:3'-5' exoribonuclease domain-containing protein [Nocardia sp. NPDC057227]|uniref:3'-5' exoribonuclease domain-containing protein n=1 Tax=Nocardia sp. NPDC057227 TaxID=3346056 RepID=UPI0036431996
MTRYSYDTEFLEDGKTIALISIGIVSESGREYYAVNRDVPVRRIRKQPWLMENVVPGLPKPAGDWNNHMPRSWLFDYHNRAVKKRDRIAAEVREFLLAEGPPELWADYGAYDHIALCQLFGRMIDLPEGLPMFTHDLQQALESAPEGFVVPQQESGLHNALEDARHLDRTLRALLVSA